MRTCSIENCQEKHASKGYCRKHYDLWKRQGRPNHITIVAIKLCLVDGCSRKYKAKGYCEKHYQLFLKHGDPLINKRNVHGCHHHPLYNTWSHMLHRCSNENDKRYHDWGGRGVKVCERWHDINNFIADMGAKPEGHSIDRIDNNGNYEPGNCRWTNWTVQNRNRRDNKLDIQKAREIRRLRKQGVAGVNIAKMFGVSDSSVSLVTLGKSWKEQTCSLKD